MAEGAAARRVVRFGVFEVDFGTGELRKAGVKIKLQDQPFQVLAMLLERPGDLITREALQSRLWPSGTFGDFEHGLNVAVKKLRIALGDTADNPRFIETLARRGYRFVGQVDNVVSVSSRTVTDSQSESNAAAGPSLVRTAPSAKMDPQRERRGLLRWAVVVILVVAAGIALWHWWPSRPSPRVVTRFTIPLPPSDEFFMKRGGLVISPDGGYLVYSATTSKTKARQLYLRPLDQNEAVSIPGTDGAIGPFFSPDGQWIAFTAGGELRKVPLHGGSPITVCAKSNALPGTWGPDGTIFFSQGSAGDEEARFLMRVAATGGTPQAITLAEKTLTEFPPRWPQVLPTGNAILYVTGGTWAAYSDDATIVAQSLKTGERKVLIQGATCPRYVSTGHLVYAQGGTLLAAPFDVDRLEITGPAFPVAEDLWRGPGGYVAYDISRDGLLVSVNSGEMSVGNRTLNWVDRTGAALPINTPARQYSQPSLSPDGKHIAVAIGDPLRQSDIWVLDLEQNVARQVTSSQAGESATAPLWTPDGKRIIYASGFHGRSLFWQAADGSGKAELLFSSSLSPSGMILATSCSPDGRFLVFQRGDTRDFNLWVLNLAGDHKLSPLLMTSFMTTYPQIAPDGRRLAYTSDESGRPEVYVQSFPTLGDKRLISVGGGEEARWSRDGRQLFYRQGNKMMAVDMQAGRPLPGHAPRLLFEGIYPRSDFWTNYDLSRNGDRFLMLKEVDETRASQKLRVVLNWTEELKHRRVGKD
ncbi:MAG: PD40 domain-containing protein [Acidobacteria bacterium]|nr:PD40 domain-containing protein [Acidobacteriota bacterium]